MMIHPTHTPITNPAMMRKGRFKSLTLPTHGMTRRIPPLTLHWNSAFGHGSRIRQGGFSMG